VKVVFACPSCDGPAQTPLDEPHDWRCPSCATVVPIAKPDQPLAACVVCGCAELYKKKDFPHALGLLLLIAAFAASAITYWLYLPTLTWAILIGTAVFDGVLYVTVGDAIVCYRCQAHHKGLPTAPAHQPFEITIGERYRQQRLRDSLKS